MLRRKIFNYPILSFLMSSVSVMLSFLDTFNFLPLPSPISVKCKVTFFFFKLNIYIFILDRFKFHCSINHIMVQPSELIQVRFDVMFYFVLLVMLTILFSFFLEDKKNNKRKMKSGALELRIFSSGSRN